VRALHADAFRRAAQAAIADRDTELDAIDHDEIINRVEEICAIIER
jgi:hypothetical protein